MYSDAELHLAYKVGNASLNLFPYPHLYLQDVFPADFYQKLQSMLPDPAVMVPIAEARNVKGYKERFVMGFDGAQFDALPQAKRTFWADVSRMLLGGAFGRLLLGKFGPFVEQRFGNDPNLQLYDETLLVQDITNYALGPHSDAPRKVITLLFYLPKDESQRHLGTSIYIPKDPMFRCAGGPHYRHEQFERLWTFPFVPNSLFAFVKTDNSFHGVEPVKDPDCRRWLLLYDLYAQTGTVAAAPAPAAGPATPPVKFSF